MSQSSLSRSKKTAIKRKTLSVPARIVWTRWGLVHPALDYGCGHGYDADYLEMDKYDPNFHPQRPKEKYALILCTYVLNTLPKSYEAKILKDIRRLLRPEGTAFISVRRDVKKDGLTKTGSYQRQVFLNLRVYRETSSYCIYVMTKNR